jgi:hypothetical protein
MLILRHPERVAVEAKLLGNVLGKRISSFVCLGDRRCDVRSATSCSGAGFFDRAAIEENVDIDVVFHRLIGSFFVSQWLSQYCRNIIYYELITSPAASP